MSGFAAQFFFAGTVHSPNAFVEYTKRPAPDGRRRRTLPTIGARPPSTSARLSSWTLHGGACGRLAGAAGRCRANESADPGGFCGRRAVLR